MNTIQRIPLILLLSALFLSSWSSHLAAQAGSDSESQEATEREYETPPLPPLDLNDEKLNQDLDRYREHLEAREFSKALAIIKRVRSKVRKPEESIAEIVDRYFREAEAGTVLDKAQRYNDKKQYRKALGIITKEDPKEEAFSGTRIGEEVSELRQLLKDEIYLVIEDFEKEKSSEESEEENAPEQRRREGMEQGQNSKIVEGTPEDGDVRSGKFAMHWQTTERLSWVSIGNKSFEKMMEEGESLTDYRYLTLSLRCENPSAKPNILVLFDVNGEQIRAPRGGMRRGGARAYQRDGFNTSVNPKGGWKEYRLDLKKFVRKGEVDWDMVEALRLIYTGGPDHLLMIDNVQLEKP